jgi:hypothetical protein
MMCGNDTADLVQLPGRESAIRGQCQRFEPESARGAVALYMNVHRLAAVEAGEEEPGTVRGCRESRASGVPFPGRHRAQMLTLADRRGPGKGSIVELIGSMIVSKERHFP